VNDRGPNRRLNRAIDLSEAAFAQIAGSSDIARGTMQVWIDLP
jgi:rare lipoprotein A (peptidoglycan hydrolase)